MKLGMYKALKRFFKRKQKINMAFFVIYLITGGTEGFLFNYEVP